MIDAVLFPDRPTAAQLGIGQREHGERGRSLVAEQRLEATMDRARRGARELLEADRPGELGEVCPARAAPAQIGRTDRPNEPANRLVTPGELVRRLDVRLGDPGHGDTVATALRTEGRHTVLDTPGRRG